MPTIVFPVSVAPDSSQQETTEQYFQMKVQGKVVVFFPALLFLFNFNFACECMRMIRRVRVGSYKIVIITKVCQPEKRV